MAAQNSRVSIVISEQDEFDLLNAIRQIPDRMKTLISLPANQRRNKRMSPKEEGRARIMLRTLQQNPSMVPADLDVVGALAKLEVLERIERIDDELQRVAAQVRDTRAGLGMDIMDVVKVGYALSKTFGHKRGLGDLIEDLGARFGRGKSKKPATPAPDVQE